MKNKIFGICLTGTVLLAAGIVFLPRYISRSLDLRNLNRIVLTDRDRFSYMEPSAYDLAGNDEGFQCLGDGTGELTLIASYDRQTVKLNEDLLKGIFDQAAMAEKVGMFSDVVNLASWSDAMGLEYEENKAYSGYEVYDYNLNWFDQAVSAEYYSLVYASDEDSHVKNMLNFWLVHYTDMLYRDYYFLVNEDSYNIYYAWIYSPGTDYFCSLLDQFTEEGYSQELELLIQDSVRMGADGCVYYYGANFYEEISWPEPIAADNPITIRMVFDTEAESVVAEQRPLTISRHRGYRGLGIGLHSIGEAFSPPET